MSNLPLTGVELIAKGQSAFFGAMDKASKAVSTFNNSTQDASKGVSVFGDVLKGTLAANAIIGAFSAAAGQISALGNQAFGAAVQMQQLEVSLESLAAREIMTAGGASDMNQALAQAGPVADNLMQKIKELSLISPFEYQDIVNVFRLNMAFGQTSEMSLELTRAILNMSAASGQGAGMMERIAYNFSQMSMTGRITQRDIRDLALAGVDVSRVLRDELGMSVEEVDNKLKSGQMTFQQVSEAFVSYADKNFGGAAERMSKTFQGLQSSFNDLITFSGLDIFGPALERVTTALQGLFATAQAFVASGALKDLGVIFGEIVGLFINDMPKATDEVTAGMIQIRDAVAQTTPEAAAALDEIMSENQQLEMRTRFQNVALEAVEWGANIVTSLAEGIIMGAAAVLSALLWLGNLIAEWLQPGSPPKILPDLPDWGASAMMEYLKGFTAADFSSLNAVSGPIEQALSLMGKSDLIPSFQMGLAKAFSTGSLDSSFIQSILDQTGAFGVELVKLTQQQLALESATQRVADAEKAVEDARKKEVEAFSAVRSEVGAYNMMLRGGAGKEQLDAQKARVDASVKAAKSARKERSEAEKNLDLQKESLSILKEQVDMQSKLVSQMLEYARAVLAAQQEEEKAKQGAGGGAGSKSGIQLPKIPVPGGGGADDPLSGISDAFQARITEIFEQMKTDIGAAWESSGIVTTWNDLVALFSFDGIFTEDQIGQMAMFAGKLLAIGAAAAFLLSPVGLLTLAVGALALAYVTGKPGLDNFAAGLKILDEDIIKKRLIPTFGVAIRIIRDDLVKALVAGSTAISNVNADIAQNIIEILDNFNSWLSYVSDDLIPTMLFGLEAMIAVTLEDIGEFIPAFKTLGEDMILGFVDGVLDHMQDAIDAVIAAIQAAIEAAQNILDSHSPSRVFMELGGGVVEGFRSGVASEAKPVNAPTRPAYIQAEAMGNVTRSATVNMGGVNIYDRMGAVEFETAIRQVLSNALGVA